MKLSFALAVGAAAIPQQPSFEEWAAQYGINGDSVKAAYEANVIEINRLNSLNTTAVFGVNQFSGMTPEEFAATMLTDREDVDDPAFVHQDVHLTESVASSIDWVALGGVTPVKDQGSCGSCWTFGAMGVVEAINKVQTGKDVILAEQQLLSCSGQGSCDGGSTTNALKWLLSHSPCLASSYPYTATDASCKSCTASGIKVTAVNLLTKSDSALVAGLNKSPVAVSVDGSQMHHYSSGILQGTAVCSHSHSVLAVGYDTGYWKIKNSWGKSWGENGFIRIARGGGSCGYVGIFDTSPRQPTVTGSSAGSCTDIAGWKNQDGDTCYTYEHYRYCNPDGTTGPGWNYEYYGNPSDWYDSQGRTANDACCCCGGGTKGMEDVVV
jgi:hypothetical protein